MNPPVDLLQRWPILAGIVVVIYLLRAALELSGLASKNLTGLTRLLSRESRADERADRRVAELVETLGIVDGQVERLKAQVLELTEHLGISNRLADAQGRAIRDHLAWDRQLLRSVRQALPDFDFPDPPELFVYEENP